MHIVGPEEHGHQGGLPVVGVDHVGIPGQMLEGLQNGLGEEGEPLPVVIVSVTAVPVEIVFVVDEVVLELLFVKTGGLGDVAAALPKALAESPNTEVAVFLPYYKRARSSPPCPQ